MTNDPLSISRLRRLAREARDSAERAGELEVKKQYENIAQHYDQLVERVVAVAAQKVQRLN
jgi:F0F1-type ATP synthase membrane subunit b/b'